MSAAAGRRHTVLLRNDGSAVAFGANERGQCDLPEIGDVAFGLNVKEAGRPYAKYIAASAGLQHTLLVRDDGEVIAVGALVERFDIEPYTDFSAK